MRSHTPYGFAIETELDPDAAEQRVRELLQEEGFGVLTEIDVQATMRAKLGVEMPPYRILGACNPKLAQLALQAEPEIGLLLPCNVVVAERPGGGSSVAFMDAEAALGLVRNPEVDLVGREASERLRRVAGRLRVESTKGL